MSKILRLTSLGPMVFLAVASVAGMFTPGYDPISQPISNLVFGPLAWLQTLNFYVFGASIIVFGIALARTLGGKSSVAAAALLCITGASLIGAGVFPAVPDTGQPTPAALVHGLTFFVTFLPLPGAQALTALRLLETPRQRGLAMYVAALPSLTFFLFALYGVLGSEPGAPLLFISGLLQRVLMIAFSWLPLVGLRMLRSGTREATQPVSCACQHAGQLQFNQWPLAHRSTPAPR